ncbi:MAG: DMT family transporter [Pseudomonadota bacterium]
MLTGRSPQLVGIACVVSAVTIFSLQDLTFKWMSDRYPLHQIVFIRGVVAISVVLALFVPLEGGYRLLLSNRIPLHLLRGLALVVGNMTFFAGLASLQLAEGVAIFFTAPLIITLLSIPFLGERVGKWRLLAVLCGLAGAAIVMRPGSEAFQAAAILPLIAAFAYSSMTIMTRKLGTEDPASVMAFYLQVMFIVSSLAIFLVAGDGRFAGSDNRSVEFLLRAWVWPTGFDLMLILVIGVLNAFGGYLISQGYRMSEASAAAPFEYVAIPLAVVWGYLVWSDYPDALSWLGIGMIISAGLFVAWREMQGSRGER